MCWTYLNITNLQISVGDPYYLGCTRTVNTCKTVQMFPGTPGQYIVRIHVPEASYDVEWSYKIYMTWRGRRLTYPRWPSDDEHDQILAEFAAEKCFGNVEEIAAEREQYMWRQEQQWESENND